MATPMVQDDDALSHFSDYSLDKLNAIQELMQQEVAASESDVDIDFGSEAQVENNDDDGFDSEDNLSPLQRW